MTFTQKERELQLDKAKMQLMMKPDTIFFTSIMFSLVYKWDTSHPTAAVDGKHMFVNPQFFDSMTPAQRQGVFIHEILHVALNHITRGLKHDRIVSNMAADYVVNLIVLDAGFELPAGALIDRRFIDMSYEQVYKILIEEQKQQETIGSSSQGNQNRSESNSQGDPIPGIGSDILPPANKAEADTIKAEIADIVFKATVQARQVNAWGSIPKAVLIELDKTLNPKLPWNIIFQNYMDSFIRDDYSWRRPNRKYLPDLIIPSQYSEAINNVAFAIDCSGSVSDKEFGFFIQEVDVVQQQLNPEQITLINFNTKIIDIHDITQDINIMKDITFTGKGGTNVRPVLEWAREHEPKVMVVLTDGWFSQPPADQYPNCPLLWVIHNNDTFIPEMGEVIHYDL